LSVEPEAMARLQAHDWPGNIRELRNALDRARLFADDNIVRSEHLPAGLSSLPRLSPLATLEASKPAPVSRGAARRLRRPAITDEDLQRLAASRDCTRRELAQASGLSERTLYRRLKALGLA
jgi:DNA-binding NtrC family response regulator